MFSQLAIDQAFCRDVTRASGSSFYQALRWLPGPKRRALNAIYAYCRTVDDAADEVAPETAVRLLAEWREELDRCFRGVPTHPVTTALAAAAEGFPIPRRALEAILEGVESDLVRRRYETWAELELYCWRVASAVGLACIEVFGYRDERARAYAESVGLALQLTNVLRDLGEDAARGRLYLPLEDLERFGVAEEALLAGRLDAPMRRLLAFEHERARGLYERAAAELPPADAASLWPAEVMRRTYRELLDRIAAEGFEVFGRRIRVPRHRQVAIAVSTWLGAA